MLLFLHLLSIDFSLIYRLLTIALTEPNRFLLSLSLSLFFSPSFALSLFSCRLIELIELLSSFSLMTLTRIALHCTYIYIYIFIYIDIYWYLHFFIYFIHSAVNDGSPDRVEIEFEFELNLNWNWIEIEFISMWGLDSNSLVDPSWLATGAQTAAACGFICIIWPHLHIFAYICIYSGRVD